MSKMAELALEIEEMAEQGFSAFSIAAKLNIPLNWAETAVEERWQLEQQKQHEMMSYDNDY